MSDDSAIPDDAIRVIFEAETADERSAALDGWVAALDREMEQTGDFATSIAAMKAHGCFDVRAVAERWILANPTGDVRLPQVQPAPAPPAPALEAPQALEEAVAPAPAEQASEKERRPPRRDAALSPDIAYFHSLLQGGIERGQIDEAFPAFRLVIDEAVGQYEAAAPILSDVPEGPTRDDLNDEIRGMRQKLQASGTRGRRRWRARD